jgi:hypothetical protein
MNGPSLNYLVVRSFLESTKFNSSIIITTPCPTNYKHIIIIIILLLRCALGQGSPVLLKLLYRKNRARRPGEKTCNYPLESQR